MLMGPVLMLQEMDDKTEENLGGLYLDLASVSAYWPRRRPEGVTFPKHHKSIGGYFGAWILCDGRVFCTIFSCSDLHEEMIRAKKEWVSVHKT